MPIAFITHPECLRHDMGSHHPECPDRLSAIEDQLIASGLAQFLSRHDAPLATREQLERVHRPDYLDAVELSSPKRGIVHLDPDTAMNPHTLEAATRAAGAVVLATDLAQNLARLLASPLCDIARFTVGLTATYFDVN